MMPTYIKCTSVTCVTENDRNKEEYSKNIGMYMHKHTNTHTYTHAPLTLHTNTRSKLSNI